MKRSTWITILILVAILGGITAALFVETARAPSFRPEDHASYEECLRNIPTEWAAGSLQRSGAEDACFYVHPARTDTAAGTAAAEASRCADPQPPARPGTRVATVYFSCTGDVSGQLYPAYRAVPHDAEPVQAALEGMLAGPDEVERSLGYQSLFSHRTAGMLHGVARSPTGDTLTIDFADFRAALRSSPNPTSFMAGGVMADITWTVFQQFPAVQALRFAFDGDEGAFWYWLGAGAGEPQAFTRTDWEQV